MESAAKSTLLRFDSSTTTTLPLSAYRNCKFRTHHSLTASFVPSEFASKSMRHRNAFNKTCVVPSSRVLRFSRRSFETALRAAAAPSTEKGGTDFRDRPPSDINVLVVGPTGYIGKFVTKELVARGFNIVAVARAKSGIGGKNDEDATRSALPGAEVLFGDVTDEKSLDALLEGRRFDVVVSCLASRTGGIQDSRLIDYQATKNSLVVGKSKGAAHFVLLSAICVQKPLLEFQRAKLQFEEELRNAKGVSYSIVRPTAFFKSLGGQVESVKGGGPYVMFGDGQLCACKPISEKDLAKFMADCVMDRDKVDRILPIGGPGEALTPLQQGEMLFEILGKEKKFIRVPIQVMDFVIGLLDSLSKLFPNLADAAEFGKIGRYYAAESMLLWDPQTQKYDADATPSYGTDTLRKFFERVIREGMEGQELGDQAVFK